MIFSSKEVLVKKGRLISSFFLLSVLIACSTGRRLDNDLQDTAYHQGDRAVVQQSQVTKDSAVGLAGLATVFSKDYYQSSSLGGECKFKPKGSDFDIPCRNVTVVLLSENGTELFKQPVGDDGAFKFSVKAGERYILSIPASKYFEKFQSDHLERGQRVMIQLIPR